MGQRLKNTLAGIIAATTLYTLHQNNPEHLTPNIYLPQPTITQKQEPTKTSKNKVKPTGYILMGPKKPIVFQDQLLGQTDTHQATLSLGPGTDQLPSNLTQEEFYQEIYNLPKRLDTTALMELSNAKFIMARGLGRAKGMPVNSIYISKENIIYDMLDISRTLEGDFPNYTKADTRRFQKTIRQDNIFQDEYLPATGFTLRASPETSTIQHYKLTNKGPEYTDQEKQIHDPKHTLNTFLTERSFQQFKQINKPHAYYAFTNYQLANQMASK